MMLLFEMNHQEARDVFQKLGVAASTDPEALKAQWKKLVLKYHPDRGGDLKTMQLINAAYDQLKKGPDASSRGQGRTRPQGHSQPQGTPQWAWAGHSGGMAPNANISRNDYSDINYIKKTMWEKSGQSREVWTVWNFDGVYFRGVFRVYGNKKIFKDMAEAMLAWDRFYKKRAIFVSRMGEKKLYLIWLDGMWFTKNPFILDHESFNSNPGNDQSFVMNLPRQLDQIAQNMKGKRIKESKVIKASSFSSANFPVIEDPTPRQFTEMFAASKYKDLRFFIHNSHLYIWDGNNATHYRVLDDLYPNDSFADGDITGYVQNDDGIMNVIGDFRSPTELLRNSAFSRATRGLNLSINGKTKHLVAEDIDVSRISGDARFRRWFQGSKVVDEKGLPLVCYHGTNYHSPINAFFSFSHFGTINAAHEKLFGSVDPADVHDEKEYSHLLKQTSSIYPVFLKITNPLEIPDLENHGTLDYFNALIEKGLLTAEKRDKFFQYAKTNNLNKNDRDKFYWDKIKRIVRGHGYDGFVYVNDWEDPGSLSWIVIEPSQIWNIPSHGVIKEAELIKTDFGKLYKNPSNMEVKELLKRSPEWRGLIMSDGNVYMGEAYKWWHAQIGNAIKDLGLAEMIRYAFYISRGKPTKGSGWFDDVLPQDGGKWWIGAMPMGSQPEAAENFPMFRRMMSKPVIAEINQEYVNSKIPSNFWGDAGAGSIIMARDTGRVLLPLRRAEVMQPHTWGTFGGRIDGNENPREAAEREAREEAGISEGRMEMVPLYVFHHGDFRYFNFLALVDHEFQPRLNWESERAEWFSLDKLPNPLHFGLQAVLNDPKRMQTIRQFLPKQPVNEIYNK